MGFSNEVRFKISGNTSGLRASFSQATSMAESAGKQMEKSLSRIDKVTSARGLLEFRRKVAFEEASTVGKIRITTERLAALSGRIATTEAGTTKQKKLQLDFDKERTKLALLRKQQQAENLAAGSESGPVTAKKAEEKESSGLSLGQLAVRGIGAAVAFALQRVISYNASRVRVDEARGESNASGLASLRSTFAAIGGAQGQLTQGKGALKDLERQREEAQRRATFLGGGLQGAVSIVAPEELTKAEVAVADLNARIQEQHNKNQLIERDLMRQLKTYDNQRSTLAKISEFYKAGATSQPRLASLNVQTAERQVRIEAEHGTPDSQREAQLKFQEAQLASQLAHREAARSVKEYDIEKDALDKINARRRDGLATEVELAKIDRDRIALEVKNEAKLGSAESGLAKRRELYRANLAVSAAQQNLRQHLLDVNQDLTGQAAEGRTFANGRARPLSETERLARQAQRFRERARNGILTGAGGDAGRFIDKAIGNEASVANRLSEASAGVKPKDVADSSTIKPEIVRSNQLLDAIKNSLQPVDVD